MAHIKDGGLEKSWVSNQVFSYGHSVNISSIRMNREYWEYPEHQGEIYSTGRHRKRHRAQKNISNRLCPSISTRKMNIRKNAMDEELKQ